MNISTYSPGMLPESLIASFASLVEEVDTEFVPALSARSGVGATDFSEAHEDNLAAYLGGLLSQHNVVAKRDGQVVGFLSYDLQSNPGSCYVSTVAVSSLARGHRLSAHMYETLLEEVTAPISVRTWTSNAAHIAVLGKMGFTLSRTIENDRGPREHTLYFARQEQMTDRYDAAGDHTKFIAVVDGIVNGSNPTVAGLASRTNLDPPILQGFLWRNHDFFYIDPDKHVHLLPGAIERADEYRMDNFAATDEEVLLAVAQIIDTQWRDSMTLTRIASLLLISAKQFSDILDRNPGVFDRIIRPDEDGNRFSRIEGPTAEGAEVLRGAIERGVTACHFKMFARVAAMSRPR